MFLRPIGLLSLLAIISGPEFAAFAASDPEPGTGSRDKSLNATDFAELRDLYSVSSMPRIGTTLLR
jgi:hypothetical protein